MSFWDRFRRQKSEEVAAEATIDTDVPPKELSKVLKIKAFPIDAQISSGRGTFEEAPYDFNRILRAYQTDSIVKTAIAKYNELMWKSGLDLVSENPKAREYLQQRLDIMSVFMGKPFEHFMREITESLFLFHNVFIVKARGDWQGYVQGLRADPQFENDEPIVGYYLLPTQSIKIMRDKNNRPKRYQQDVQSSGGKTPEWKAEDVIHLAVDRKPGNIFGEPFLESVLEDLMALRQLEEDILNLTHRELFPLLIYKVGTEESRAEDGEVEAVQQELNNMRTDAGLVIPWRHDVDIKGSEGEAMNASDYLKYFRQRVVVGTGISEVHLGIMDVANRSVSERLDIGLYDRIKNYQRFLESHINLLLINELLLEGGFDPYETPISDGASDRVSIKFKEIDTESQIKRENNAVFKFVSNAITSEEMREEMGMDPLTPEQEKRLQAQMILMPMAAMTARAMNTPGSGTSPGQAQPKSPNQAKPKSTSSGATNKSRPSNQYGTRLSPKVTHGHLLPPELYESDSSLNGILQRINDSPFPNDAAEEEFENIVSFIFSQAETGLWRSVADHGGALSPGWLEEITKAARTRVHALISLFHQQIDTSGVLLPIAVEMLEDSVSRLGWNFYQAGYLYGTSFAIEGELKLTSGSEECEICERVCNQPLNREYITFERLLAIVHSPCNLKLENT